MQVIKNLIKKYFSSFVYFYSYLKYRIFIVLLLSILIGILDGVGLTMFLPLLQLADGSSEAGANSLGRMGEVVNFLKSYGIVLNIQTVLIMMFLFFTAKGGVFLYSLRYNIRVSQFFISTLRIKLTTLFTRYSFKHFVTADVGKIQSAFTADSGRVANAYTGYSTSIQNLIMVLVYTSFVFFIDWSFALLVTIGGALTNLLLTNLFKETKKKSAELSKNIAGFHGFLIQYIAHFKYLKATAFIFSYANRLNNKITDVENNNKEISYLSAKISALREPLLMAVICVVILFQVKVMGGSLSSILISLLFFYRALSALMLFQNSYNNFLGNVGSVDVIKKFEAQLNEQQEHFGVKEYTGLKEKIVVKDLDFGYFEESGILNNLNLEICKNTSIALVGESGSGKTTLANILVGLFKPNKGGIMVDETSLHALNLPSYQARIGYITQDPVVFNDSIYNNVTLWAEKTPENERLFKEALKKASIDEFVNTLPQKGESLLGNNGINLSGGQKQRISIARELFKDIDILVLDEATSALDSETEKNIQMNIDKFKGQYTIIIIAHRLSTIKNVDMIYLMDKGEIIGKGAFQNLYKENERFKKMVDLQEV